MERSSAVKQGLRLVATSVFLAAALLTTGCGENALMNPVGETVQDGNTADMIFPVPALIAYLSRYMTLHPGDLIATGTPAGPGAFRDPPRWLKPGDRLRIEVERVGVREHAIG